MALDSFARTFGLGALQVALSFEVAASGAQLKIRDAKSSIVASATRTAVGRYTVTFARGLGRCVAGVVGVNAAATGATAPLSYVYTDAIPSTLEIRSFAAGALADLVVGDRVSFIGVFSPRSDLRDAA